MIGERKRPLLLSEFAHICYINIWLNGNGFPLRGGSARRSLQHKPFCVSLFSKPHSCFQHLEFRAKGGDGVWCWRKVVGNASQIYLVFWTAGWARRRSEVQVPPPTHPWNVLQTCLPGKCQHIIPVPEPAGTGSPAPHGLFSSCATFWASFSVVFNSNTLHHFCPQEHTFISYLFLPPIETTHPLSTLPFGPIFLNSVRPLGDKLLFFLFSVSGVQ